MRKYGAKILRIRHRIERFRSGEVLEVLVVRIDVDRVDRGLEMFRHVLIEHFEYR